MKKQDQSLGPSLMTLDDVAHILRVDYKTVYRLVHKGEIEVVKVGRVFRVTPKAFDKFMRAAKEKVRKARRKSY